MRELCVTVFWTKWALRLTSLSPSSFSLRGTTIIYVLCGLISSKSLARDGGLRLTVRTLFGWTIGDEMLIDLLCQYHLYMWHLDLQEK